MPTTPRACVHTLRVSLNANVTRDIEIASAASLHDLAECIVRAFDFDFDHAFGFYSRLTGHVLDSPEKYELFADLEDGDSDAQSVQRTTVAQAFRTLRKKMLFLFDYGDEWTFTVEFTAKGEKLPKTRYPRIAASAGKAPAQYPPADEA